MGCEVLYICFEEPEVLYLAWQFHMWIFLILAQVFAKHLSEEEIGRLRGMFKAVDNGNSGAITLAELKEGLRKCGLVFKNIEISDIMEAVSNYYVEH